MLFLSFNKSLAVEMIKSHQTDWSRNYHNFAIARVVMRMMVIGVMGVLGTFRALIIFSLSSNATLNILFPSNSIFWGIRAKNFQD